MTANPLEEYVNALLRDTVTSIVGVLAIRGKQQNAPRPTGPYAVVNFVSGVDLGYEQSTLTNNTEDPDITETIEGLRNMLYSVTFFRGSAYDNARKYRTGLARQNIRAMFRSRNVGINDRSAVRDLTNPSDTTWEDQAQLDVTVNVVGVDIDTILSIQSVAINMAHEANNKSITLEIEVGDQP